VQADPPPVEAHSVALDPVRGPVLHLCGNLPEPSVEY
jgi:hypothetical protein